MATVECISSPEDLEKFRQEIKAKREPSKLSVSVCVSTGCVALGGLGVMQAFKAELDKQGLKDKVELKETGCLGFCEQGPRVTIYPEEICYLRVQPEDVSEIVSKTILEKQVVERLLYKDRASGRTAQKLEDIPFYKYQLRLLLGDNAKIDPKNIDDYIVLGGYDALAKSLFKMTPEQVIEEIKRANLRGRGGGGFPTGSKWETTRGAPGEPKYVVVNCDQGDPGAFMDRSLMEGNPHSVLEGLIIGGYAIGAHEGFVYVREEYPIAVENISVAIKQAEQYGLLGENIMGSGFDFRVKVHRGAGAFVSGESSALMTAIEGKVGEPRPKYVHTAVKGIWDKPSCLNNDKTWATVPLIILRGAEWFKRIGTKGSSGTMIFSLVGKVNNTGLVEVPMGITLRDLIYKIGGGIRAGKKFKAVQTGGPSGGLIPEEYLDLPVDFDELAKVGSMMGSGGMVVMDEDTCMVDTAKYFVDFLLEESCGKCIPCREGLRALSKILNDICEGKGKDEDLKTTEDIAETMRDASLCALGQTAANPVLSSMKYFRDEWEQHIGYKCCSAGACKALTNYYIDPKKCQACLFCLKECPAGAVQGGKNQVHWVDQAKCVKCGTCYEVCNFNAVKKLSAEPIPPPPTKGTKPIRKRK
ncbi:MAG TPA: NADH-ubiquinone oxidoreductase-F iron-sulfur binding region domain-containing protein [Candidatus Bathyarchaeia archaeon]|nr:NADH-ubiquinone oxidoreductase-F iron-sulfur binding region domain-containing protein [Candidatus Bathyarchaeia archaeon]